MRVAVQAEPFDFGAEAAAFTRDLPGAGAVVTFTGLVRDLSGDLAAMQIEHYPGMTERAIAAIAGEAMTRWSLVDCLVIHRHGDLAPGETIMMVATASAHRGDAFAAAEFLMDYLKSRAPFWKKEITTSGAEWVAAKDADEDALKRW
ncbi:molybdenum cofactor biosynthesis protein MoaE [Cereibacter changlensis JA139]|uniref:Molybdopterin synthase catalytic subunit n=2 Tax=Cereibacter changlensis TaxID=402884 RepID=A0A2T4JNE1_9RHOB|nr:molybdenum cofactor biosynthesis protein MoaE [Cereibacter changlensis]PTE19424.1 molybdenum cofactor biosynthesis protein MoaE [Cereibacter changlensis JA139]PZX50895.1 molybdopterin synthase subunit MoaE [Cereibacter changlensis]